MKRSEHHGCPCGQAVRDSRCRWHTETELRTCWWCFVLPAFVRTASPNVTNVIFSEIKLKIFPDFIAVDGGEGGTGAAPLEYSNSIGMPLNDGLSFVSDCLNGFDIKKHIKIIASGKVITGFNIIRNVALGADMVNSARAMMMALGCIQALECNKNICPTGVATQNPELVKGLVVNDKSVRVANYHRETVDSVIDLLSATGHNVIEELTRYDMNRRISEMSVKRFDEIYPTIKTGAFVNGEVPKNLI